MEGDGQHKKLNKRQKKLVRRLMEMFKPHVEEEIIRMVCASAKYDTKQCVHNLREMAPNKDLIIPEDLEKPIADALFAVLSHKGSEDEEQRRREEERHELHITEVALMQSLELHRKGEHLSDGKIETLDCGSSSSSSSSSGGGGGGSSSSSDLGNKNKKHEWPDMEVMVDELVNDDEKDTEKGKGKGKARLGEEAIPQKNNRNDYPVRGRVIRTPSERRQEEMMSSREEEWSCQYCESLNEGEKGDKSAECNLCGVLRGSLGSIVSESRLPPEGQEGIYASAAPVSSLQQSQEFLHASFFKLMFPMFRQEDLEQVIREQNGDLDGTVNLLLECSTENILTALPTKLEEEEYLQDEEDDEEAAKKLRAELEDAQFPSLGAVARPKLPPPAKKKKQAANKRVTDSLASIENIELLAEAFPEMARGDLEVILSSRENDLNRAVEFLVNTDIDSNASAERVIRYGQPDGSTVVYSASSFASRNGRISPLQSSGSFPRLSDNSAAPNVAWGGGIPDSLRQQGDVSPYSSGSFPTLPSGPAGVPGSGPQGAWSAQEIASRIGDELTMASRLKLDSLHMQFPDLDMSVLEGVFRSKGENLSLAITALNELFPSDRAEKVQKHFTNSTVNGRVAVRKKSEKGTKWTTPSGSKKQERSAMSAHIPGYDTMKSQKSGVDRDDALQNLQKWTDLRVFYTRRATAAYMRGDNTTATRLSARGRECEGLMKQYRTIAFAGLGKRAASGTIDLHGLPLQDAMEVVERVLSESRQAARRSGERRSLCIITGKGLHSAGGKAKIRPGVKRYLNELGMRYRESPGLFVVDVAP